MIFFGAFLPSTWAYIPDYSMIMSRVAEGHGRGAYEIDQEVTFALENDVVRVKETWVIRSEYEMSVTLVGLGPLQGLIEGRIVYDRDNKYFLDSSRVRKSPLTADWWQPFFHFRYSKNIKPKIVALKMAPSSSLEERRTNPAKPQPLAQDFIRLSRAGGAVNYAIGTPSPVDGPGSPSLWIEQDNFFVRKIRLPSQAVVSTGEYSRYPKQQNLPKTMSVVWDDKQAQILITEVSALGTQDARNQLIAPGSLSKKEVNNKPLKLPDLASIREFYQRFR